MPLSVYFCHYDFVLYLHARPCILFTILGMIGIESMVFSLTIVIGCVTWSSCLHPFKFARFDFFWMS